MGRRTGTLAVRVWKAPLTSSDTGETGGLSGPPLLGSAAAIAGIQAIYKERNRQGNLYGYTQNWIVLLLDPPAVPGFTLTSAYRPAREVGGDFFQIVPVAGGSTLIVLGDVSGKGLRAAMAVSLIVGAVRALADDYPQPAALLTQLNRRLCGRLQGGFATCVAVSIGPGGECSVASAGHPAPYVNDRELPLPGALPLGLDPETTYQEFAAFPPSAIIWRFTPTDCSKRAAVPGSCSASIACSGSLPLAPMRLTRLRRQWISGRRMTSPCSRSPALLQAKNPRSRTRR